MTDEHKIEHARLIARMYSRNCAMKIPIPAFSKKSPKKFSFNNTKNVNKRNNPKLCLICDKPYINMTCHIKEQHKISSTDPEYRRLIEEAEVVPKCFTKKVGQKTVVLSNEEIEKVIEEKPSIEAEQACLKRLKALRTDLCLKIQKNDANDAEVVSARNLYMSERYRNLDDYPNQIKLWQETFTKNFIDNGDNNPSAGTTMAFKVLKPYFGNDLADLDYLSFRTVL